MRKMEKELRFNQCLCSVIQNQLTKHQNSVSRSDTDVLLITWLRPRPFRKEYAGSVPIRDREPSICRNRKCCSDQSL